MPPLLRLMVFGLMDVAVVSWFVISSVKSGTSQGTHNFRRDDQPVQFWLVVGTFVLMGAALLAAFAHGVFWPDPAAQP